MHTIKTETKYGGQAENATKGKVARDGIKLAIVAQLSDEQLVKLAPIALASLAYRGGASALNKALGVEKNSEVEFSDDVAKKATEGLVAFFKSEGYGVQVTASRHVHGAGGGSEGFVHERAAMSRHESKGDLEEWLAGKVGFGGPTHTEDGEDYNPDALRAVRKYAQTLLD